MIWPQDPWALPLNETFLSENLKDAGYYTAYMGCAHTRAKGCMEHADTSSGCKLLHPS
eukprot:COSAG01_NODE_555_length_15533_cov_35.243310_14_plen_58_part_00